MNSRHIQNFLMVSAAFFVTTARARAKSGHLLAAAVAHSAQIAETTIGVSQVRFAPAKSADDTHC